MNIIILLLIGAVFTLATQEIIKIRRCEKDCKKCSSICSERKIEDDTKS